MVNSNDASDGFVDRRQKSEYQTQLEHRIDQIERRQDDLEKGILQMATNHSQLDARLRSIEELTKQIRTVLVTLIVVVIVLRFGFVEVMQLFLRP
mgnify:FL=1